MDSKDILQFSRFLQSLIQIDDKELEQLLGFVKYRTLNRNAMLQESGKPAEEVYFVLDGFLRVLLTDHRGTEHTVHFTYENMFISEYSAFITSQPAAYSIQALEPTRILSLNRQGIEWGYQNLKEGQKLGRLIAEYYFIYLDDRIRRMYLQTPAERYKQMNMVFPGILQRAPQHMIASYLGITPVHLSRIKSTKA